MRIALLLCLLLPACIVEDAPRDDDDDGEAGSAVENATESSPCMLHGDCAPGSLCRFAPGSCGAAAGTCAPADAPPDAFCDTPVCGCDGRDYASACEAWSQGVSVSQSGSCAAPAEEPPPPDEPPLCGGAVCGSGEFCWFDDGSCGDYGASSGQCKATDGACTSAAAAMCGCDGVTYPSLCDAVRAGVSVRHEGPC